MRSLQKEGWSGGERRYKVRYYVHTEVDFQIVGDDESFWGVIKDLSHTGVGISTRQPLSQGQQLTLRFRLHAVDGKSITEEVPATVMWASVDATGLQFDDPILPWSPMAKKAPHLLARLQEKGSSGRIKPAAEPFTSDESKRTQRAVTGQPADYQPEGDTLRAPQSSRVQMLIAVMIFFAGIALMIYIVMHPIALVTP